MTKDLMPEKDLQEVLALRREVWKRFGVDITLQQSKDLLAWQGDNPWIDVQIWLEEHIPRPEWMKR